MKLFCSLFLILIGVIGHGLQFIAVAIQDIGPLSFTDAVFALGLGEAYIFCSSIIVVGILSTAFLLFRMVIKKYKH